MALIAFRSVGLLAAASWTCMMRTAKLLPFMEFTFLVTYKKKY